jgi:predicted Zn-dependent peptidase
LPEICDVLTDMFLNSRFASDEIERERDVIREEIMSYRDHPEQHAAELLTETMWPEHPLGRPLTGDVATLSRFRRKQLMDFQRTNYNARTTVVTVAGPVGHERVVELLQAGLRQLPAGRRPRFSRVRPQDGRARVALASQETEQTHVAMGFHAFGRRDSRRFALRLLSVILGENMSSRLFQSLRERHGYCYSVQTSIVTLDDTGCIHVSAGIEPAKGKKSVSMIMRELGRICQQKPSARELRKAQDYTLGQTFMGLESTTSQMMWMGESILGYGQVLNPCEIENKVCAVTSQDVQRVACHCLNRGRLGMAVVGPVKDSAEVEKWIA